MAYYPRVRARSIVARIRTWPQYQGEPKPLGFAGYKVGMLHVYRTEDNPNSPFHGREIFSPVTVLETPPLKVIGIRAYTVTPYGLKAYDEVWASELPNYLDRVFTIPKKTGVEAKINELKSDLEKVHQFRFIVCTQPWLTGIGKKKPEVFEIAIGGEVDKVFDYAVKKLGEEIAVKEVFTEGQFLDVVSVTKGKGFQGVVKRFGVKILPRWHKHRKGYRRIGSVGPTKPAIMFTTPRAGQTGFHQRTEYNKRLLKIGKDPSEVNLKGGFKHYGLVRNHYVLIEGSVPGAIKRLVKLRYPVRPPTIEVTGNYNITYISSKGVTS